MQVEAFGGRHQSRVKTTSPFAGMTTDAFFRGIPVTAMYERNADEGTRRERVAMVPKGRFLTPDDTGRSYDFARQTRGKPTLLIDGLTVGGTG